MTAVLEAQAPTRAASRRGRRTLVWIAEHAALVALALLALAPVVSL